MKTKTKTKIETSSVILIRAAAIRTKHGTFEGLSHEDIRRQGGISGDEGFVLTDGRFVGRLNAARIAYNAGQAPCTVIYQTTGLSSSDLVNNYPPEGPASAPFASGSHGIPASNWCLTEGRQKMWSDLLDKDTEK